MTRIPIVGGDASSWLPMGSVAASGDATGSGYRQDTGQGALRSCLIAALG
ncbi:MAG TPA: hypothetical protein VGP30_04750 [Candidatus Limnocylindrales bacterium]|nr:hypothetical protein [Candidatus Limnocylindrales bacterium]